MENFKAYLQKKGLSDGTIHVHYRYLRLFLDWLKKESLAIEEATYNNILAFIKYCRSNGRSSRNINQVLSSVRYYYNYLSKSKEIKNPAAGLFIKGARQRIPHGLLSIKALEELYSAYGTNSLRAQRNKVILGLFIYQAITTEELRKSEPGHFKLKEGKIYIPSGNRSNSRVLKLEPQQIMEIHEYLNVTRPKIISDITEGKINIKPGRKPVNIDIGQINHQLFISINGSTKIKNSLLHMFMDLKKLNPKVRNAMQIRISVITEWLKSKDLRRVQYMAGHRYVSSTERYKVDQLKDLQEALKKHHPLACE